MEKVILTLLGICIIVLVYLRSQTKARVWRFGIAPPTLICELVSVRRSPGANMFSVRAPSGYIVLELESELVSRLPERMYEGESEVVILHPLLKEWKGTDSILVVDLATSFQGSVRELKEARTELEEYALLYLTRQVLTEELPKFHIRYLSIELLATGFEISGERTQKQDLQCPILTYAWGIKAVTSGKHKIALVLKVEDENEIQTNLIGTILHEVKVASVARLTQRQIKILTAILGTCTALLAILEALQRLNFLHK